MVYFNNKILIIGGGAVAQCTIPLILRHIKIEPKNITVIDAVDTRKFMREVLEQGVVFQQQEITKDNFPQVLGTYLNTGDICIDLANEVDTLDILTWCLPHQVMYLNTSMNLWKNHISINISHAHLKDMAKEWTAGSPTAIISHGANPGLISAFAKQALIDSGLKIVEDNALEPEKIKIIKKALSNENFAELAHALQIKTIHVSERDSQKLSRPKKKNEFLNTWSVIEFINESTSKVEFAWGTHEQKIPANSTIVDNNILIDELAVHTVLKSWVPQEEIEGIVPPHDETFSLADYLTIQKDSQVLYRPTIAFVYDPSAAAKKSLHEFILNNLALHEHYRVIKDELVTGGEKMGCLLMGNIVSWWTGSILSFEESNELIPKQNATVMQVAVGVLSALYEMMKYPRRGICFPENLDYKEVLKLSKPYLGDFVSEHVTWKPTKNTTWEFQDFVVKKKKNKIKKRSGV